MKPKDLYEDPVFCPAPWNNLYIHPDGNILTCSVGKVTLGNLNDSNIEDFVEDNEILKDLQQTMIDGLRHRNCKNCYSLEDTGVYYSLRKHYKSTITNFNNLEQYDRATGNLDITSLDIRYDNTCQNACVYCGPEYSNRWEKELGVTIKKPTNTQNTKQYILDNLKNLKEIYFAGGEPLINKDFVVIMQELYRVNPNCKVRINSNIKNIDTPAYEISKNFINLRYTISAESINEQYEYIRYPQTWSNFQKNIKRLINEVPSYNFNMTLNVLNVYSLFDCIDYLRSIGTHDNSFIITHAHEPIWCDICNLSDEIIQEFIEKCTHYMQNTDPRYSLYSALGGCIEYVKQPFIKDINSTINNLEQLDIRRNLNSRKTFPYIYK